MVGTRGGDGKHLFIDPVPPGQQEQQHNTANSLRQPFDPEKVGRCMYDLFKVLDLGMELAKWR